MKSTEYARLVSYYGVLPKIGPRKQEILDAILDIGKPVTTNDLIRYFKAKYKGLKDIDCNYVRPRVTDLEKRDKLLYDCGNKEDTDEYGHKSILTLYWISPSYKELPSGQACLFKVGA